MYSLHINGWTPPAIAVAITLREKGIEFDLATHEWQSTAAALRPFIGQIEPLNTLEGEFPILVADGVAISDSYFILEYLEDRHPGPAMKPADAYGQWQVQALARFLGERASPAVSSLGVATQFAGSGGLALDTHGLTLDDTLTPERRDAWRTALTDPANDTAIAESRRKIGLLFDRLDKMLDDSGGPWLLGAAYTLSDIAAFVLIDPFLSGQLPIADIDPTAQVRSWHERVSERPAVATTIAVCEPAFLPGPEHARWG